MISYIGDIMSGDFSFIDFLVHILSIAFVVFCAAPLHEFAHALIAVKLGDNTPRNMGRLTIDPMVHIDKRGALMIFLFGFGYAKPVQVRMRNFKNPKRDMAIVALAGPVCNLLQAFFSMFLFNLFKYVAYSVDNMIYVAMFFYFAALINTNLAIFNFIPIPPLDGSRLTAALLPSKYYYKMVQYERYIYIALIVLLFTGVLSTPLGIASAAVVGLFDAITSIPFV